MSRTSLSTSTLLLDRPPPPPGQEEINLVRVITPGYLEALRIPMLDGRAFEGTDNEVGQAVAIVSQAFADEYYENGDAVGKQMQLDFTMGMEEPSRIIVGVAGDLVLAG